MTGEANVCDGECEPGECDWCDYGNCAASDTTHVYVVGEIWEPGVGLCAMTYAVNGLAANREAVAAWLDKNAGDFERIADFSFDGGEWADACSAAIFAEATYA